MKNTCQRGNVTEVKVMAKLIELGYLVFIPFGEGHKIDLIFLQNNIPKRVQIKTSRQYKEDRFTFNLYSNGGGYNKVYYSSDQIDYFATEFNNKIYLIPIQDLENKKNILLSKDNPYQL